MRIVSKNLVSIALIGVAVFISGCSSDVDQGMQGFDVLKTAYQNRKAKAVPAQVGNPLPSITREMLKEVPGPFLFAHIKNQEVYSSLSLVGTNKDVQTFASPDGATVAFKAGAVIATRGLGGDLLASDVSGVLQAISPGDSDPYQREFRRLNAENHTLTVSFSCVMKDAGGEKITIVEKTYKTRHMVESCNNDTKNIQNDFWVAKGKDNIIKSVQWVGPHLEYVEILVLVE